MKSDKQAKQPEENIIKLPEQIPPSTSSNQSGKPSVQPPGEMMSTSSHVPQAEVPKKSAKRPDRRRKENKKRLLKQFPDTPSTTPLVPPGSPNAPVFTPDQARILNVLADGLPHTKKELLDCLHDPVADWAMMAQHIKRIRDKIKPYGGDLIPRLMHRRIMYQRIMIHNYTPE